MKTQLLRAYGSDPISYSTLQSGLSYFETSFGYVAYQPAIGFDLTLGPPVCAPADRAEMIERFLRARRAPIFFYVQKEIAQLAGDIGGRRFHVCGMGVDKLISLAEPAETHPRVKGALKKAARGGLVVSEVQATELTTRERNRISEITDHFLRRSAVPVEMHFLNRPFALDTDAMARTFLLRHGEDAEVFGYAALDPYYRNGAVAGYLLNQLRFEPTRLWGVYYSTVSTLAKHLRGEQVPELSLGFCPLVDVDAEGCSPGLARQVQWMEQRFASVTYLARLREMKEAFAGKTVQRYFVTPSRWVAATALAFFRACRVPLWPIIAWQFRARRGAA